MTHSGSIADVIGDVRTPKRSKTKTCPVCEKEFAYGKNTSQKLCSRDCAAQKNRQVYSTTLDISAEILRSGRTVVTEGILRMMFNED